MQIVSYLAMLICILLFIYINTQHRDPIDMAIKAGALYPPKVRNGEYWRLVTAGFVHVQIYHILMNMYSLYNWRWLERFIGSGKYALVLLVSIIAGNLLAYRFSKDNHVTLGISGGIYGLVGLYVVIMIKYTGMSLISALQMLLPSIIVSFMPNISLYGHLGGLLAGLILGTILI